MDFARFFGWQDDYRMIKPKPGEQDRLFAFVRPFAPTVIFLIIKNNFNVKKLLKVWLILGICLFASIIIMSVAHVLLSRESSVKHVKTSKKMGTRATNKLLHFGDLFVTYSLYLINTLTNHGKRLSSPRNIGF